MFDSRYDDAALTQALTDMLEAIKIHDNVLSISGSSVSSDVANLGFTCAMKQVDTSTNVCCFYVFS